MTPPTTPRGALLVAGATSDAGKSVLVTALCRYFARQGVSVAPFKAQNMSPNSTVSADGAEISRIQAVQAAAAGVAAEAAMNPVLLKPGSDTVSQVIVHGQPLTEVHARNYGQLTDRLRAVAAESLAELRSRFEVVICEGAGSPAEINLRHRDFTNMGLAVAAGLPTILVGDIDRGGFFAAMLGTLAALDGRDQRLLCGFVANKFRGDISILQPGLDQLAAMTGRPTYGVLPWIAGMHLDAEDSLDFDAAHSASGPVGKDWLRIAVIRLPRMAHSTDLDPFTIEPGVDCRLTTDPRAVQGADLVIIPDTRALASDLGFLRERGLADALAERAAAGRPVLGIGAGYHVLAERIELGGDYLPGLGLLPAVVRPATRVARRVSGSYDGHAVDGYEITDGAVEVGSADTFPGGCTVGATSGTTWHGIVEADGFRRGFLAEIAAAAGRAFTPAPDTSVTALREARFDLLADVIEEHLDLAAITGLITAGPPATLPTLTLQPSP